MTEIKCCLIEIVLIERKGLKCDINFFVSQRFPPVKGSINVACVGFQLTLTT